MLTTTEQPRAAAPVNRQAEWHWPPKRYQLVSLWDMLRFNAHAFVTLLRRIQDTERYFGDGQKRMNEIYVRHGITAEAAQKMVEGGVDEAGDNGFRKEIQEEWRRLWEACLPSLDAAERACVALEADSAVDKIKRMRQRFKRIRQVGELEADFRKLGENVVDHLQRRSCFFVPPDRAKFFETQYPFGKAVQSKFPKLAEDIAEASKCMGVGRFTAAVFHLMRVLEIAIQRLARHLGTTAKVQDSWGIILAPIDAAIDNLPGGQKASQKEVARKAAFSEAAAYLRHVKDAWRNTTMHPKRTYTEEEASNIFEGTKMFIQSLVRLR